MSVSAATDFQVREPDGSATTCQSLTFNSVGLSTCRIIADPNGSVLTIGDTIELVYNANTPYVVASAEI